MTACLGAHTWFVSTLQIHSWNFFFCWFPCSVCVSQVQPGPLRAESQSEMTFLSHYEICLFSVSLQWNIFIWKDFRWFRRLHKVNHLWLKYRANKEVKDRVRDFLRGMKSNSFSKSSQIVAELSSFKYNYESVAVHTFPCLLWCTHLQWVGHLYSNSAYLNNRPHSWALNSGLSSWFCCWLRWEHKELRYSGWNNKKHIQTIGNSSNKIVLIYCPTRRY